MQKLFIFFILAIIYGSLYPFEFSFVDGPTGQWDILLNSVYPFGGLGDTLGNIVLFVPFGFLGFEAISKSGKDKITYIKLFCWGFVLALALQIIQIYIPFRTPSLSDIYWNESGIAFGIVAALVVESRYPKLSLSKVQNIPAILSLFWLGYLLFPFIPTLDVQQIKDSLKQVILYPKFNFDDLLFITTAWLSFAYFTNNFFHQPFINRYRLPLFVIATLLVRVNIFSNYLDLSDVLAGLLAITIWYIVLDKHEKTNKILCFLFVLTILVKGRGSLDFFGNTGFSWVPFSGFLQGSIYENSKIVFYKIFLYGSLLWLVKESFKTVRFTTLYCFSMICSIEILQIFMISHNAEITDGLLILLLSRVIRIPKEPFKTYQTPLNIADTVTGNKINEGQLSHTNEIPTVQTNKSLKPVIIGIVAITVAVTALLRLPGIPYNVRELFLLDGMFITIIPFALFVLWFGMSIPLIVSKLMASRKWGFIKFPGLVFLSVLISYLLLKISVTSETMGDITGASNTLWFVTNKEIWGDFGLLLVYVINWPPIWNVIEQVVRFLALFSPVTFMLCIVYMSLETIKKHKLTDFISKFKLITKTLLLYTLYSLPWFLLCKYIAFDKSSTDNLNELIAVNGFFGMGGGAYLYFLFVLLTANAVIVTRYLNRKVIVIVLTLCASILGWFLLNCGLESEVHKYGSTFSGVDFLLGPDRRNLLSKEDLFFRWFIIYVCFVITLTWGMKNTFLSSLLQKREIIANASNVCIEKPVMSIAKMLPRTKTVPGLSSASNDLDIAKESSHEGIRKARIKRKKSDSARSQTGIKLDISKGSDSVSRKRTQVKWTKASIRFRKNQIQFLKEFSKQKEVSVSRAVRSMIASSVENADNLKARLARNLKYRTSQARSDGKESRIINLHEEQLAFLNTLAREKGISVSRVVRLIIDDFKKNR